MSTKQSKPNSSNLNLTIQIKKDQKTNYLKILSKQTKYPRSTATIKESPTLLTIEIAAKDIPALRASTNSILRDIQVIMETKI